MSGKYWDDRHIKGDTPWNIGMASTPLVAYMSQVENKNSRILIPGAGDAHEAKAFVEMGFTDITICDISETAISKIRNSVKHIPGITCICEDFFMLEGSFDLIIEQTFFCALEPDLRTKYVDKMYELLAPGGKLVGVLFNRQFLEEGPPWGGTLDEYKTLLSKKLHIKVIDICYNSISKREGTEVFFMAERSI